MKDDLSEPVPHMRLAAGSAPVLKVKRGMTIDGVREIWRVRSEAKSQEIMRKYNEQKAGRIKAAAGIMRRSTNEVPSSLEGIAT